MGALSLLLLGALAGALAWLGLAWLPSRLAPAEHLRAFAASRGAMTRGDGRVEPLVVLGQVAGRAFTISWQRALGAGDVLLVGVDCAAGEDGALVTRWVRPEPERMRPEALGTLLDAMAELAADLERTRPPTPPED